MTTSKDITGMPVGNLKVLYIDDSRDGYWMCRCKCGSLVSVRKGHLTRGATQNCRKCGSGWHRKDMVGEHCGEYTVLEFAGIGSNKGSYDWKCQCSCGVIKIVRGSMLRSRVVISCGHVQRENTAKRNKELHTTHGLSGTKVYRNWTVRKREEMEELLDSSWTLEMEESIFGFFRSCVLCGSDEFLAVDHLLPLFMGYGAHTDNAVVLCRSCNSIKSKKYITELPKETRQKLIEASCAFQDHLEEQMYRHVR